VPGACNFNYARTIIIPSQMTCKFSHRPRQNDMRSAHQLLKSLLPSRATANPAGAGLPQTTREVFASVYRKNLWGRSLFRKFYSGPGSHDADLVEPYIKAVRTFLATLPAPADVVDLGCGDFNVGRRLRDACHRYVACDVVPELVAHNGRRFAALDVDFKCVDITNDPLPEGDIVFLRQVLQHLDNAQILQVLSKLNHYRFLVLTEHLPDAEEFTPNADQHNGSGIRLNVKSGVVLTAPPFNLQPRSEQTICCVKKYGGTIRTTVYGLR